MDAQPPRGERIISAYEDLRTARIEMAEITEKEIAAKDALKHREADLLLSGAIIGKNAETRDAQLKEGCKMELEAVEAVRKQKAEVQLRQDIAAMNVQELQWLVRSEQAAADLIFAKEL